MHEQAIIWLGFFDGIFYFGWLAVQMHSETRRSSRVKICMKYGIKLEAVVLKTCLQKVPYLSDNFIWIHRQSLEVVQALLSHYACQLCVLNLLLQGSCTQVQSLVSEPWEPCVCTPSVRHRNHLFVKGSQQGAYVMSCSKTKQRSSDWEDLWSVSAADLDVARIRRVYYWGVQRQRKNMQRYNTASYLISEETICKRPKASSDLQYQHLILDIPYKWHFTLIVSAIQDITHTLWVITYDKSYPLNVCTVL